MKILKTHISGLVLFETKIFEDERGTFCEIFNEEIQDRLGQNIQFVQDNLSVSKKNVLRGLHFQVPPYAQGKLVRVIRGSVIDVAVDLRKKSPTFGHYEKFLLTESNNRCLYIPEGFAHGFASLEDCSTLFYKCTKAYNKDADRVLLWNDPNLNIDWEINSPIISQKDHNGLTLPNFTQTFPNL